MGRGAEYREVIPWLVILTDNPYMAGHVSSLTCQLWQARQDLSTRRTSFPLFTRHEKSQNFVIQDGEYSFGARKD